MRAEALAALRANPRGSSGTGRVRVRGHRFGRVQRRAVGVHVETGAVGDPRRPSCGSAKDSDRNGYRVVFTALRAGRARRGPGPGHSRKACPGWVTSRPRAVADKLILQAETLDTRHPCGHGLRYHALKIDPSLARKKYEWSVADRKVFLQPYADGTAEIGGVNPAPHIWPPAAYDPDRPDG